MFLRNRFAIRIGRAGNDDGEIGVAVVVENQTDDVFRQDIIAVFVPETDFHLELAHGVPHVFPGVLAVEIGIGVDQILDSAWKK